jgi:succinate dehydrogenase/fumarate reductase flavoprotein subunit
MIMKEATMRTASPTVDNLVIGGGLAGSTVAIRIPKQAILAPLYFPKNTE